MQTEFKTSKYKPGKLELWASFDPNGMTNLIMVTMDGTYEFMYSSGNWTYTYYSPESIMWQTPFEFLGYL